MRKVLELLEKERNRYRGKWVAVKDGKVLFASDSYKDIYRMIWDSGEAGDIFVIYVPTEEDEAFRKAEKIKLSLV